MAWSLSQFLFALLAFFVEQSAAQQVVLDDMGSTNMMHALEGSYAPCMEDAYNGMFHHDGGINKGSTSLTFDFDPPQKGCYRIDEYHPGGDSYCARYLPRRVSLEVEYCQGKTTHFAINQADRGGQWNEVGSLPFCPGHKGKLTLSNSPNEECDADNCFWVADAFRLTRTGKNCSAQETNLKVGVLKFTVRGNGGNDGILQERLRAHQRVFEDVLEAKLSSPKVEILNFATAHGRRLNGFPDIAFELRFRAHRVSDTISLSSNADLEDALQNAFSEVGVGVTFQSASLEWSVPAVPKPWLQEQSTQDDGISIETVPVIALVAGAVVLGLILSFAVVILRCALKHSGQGKEKTPKLAKPQFSDMEAAPAGAFGNHWAFENAEVDLNGKMDGKGDKEKSGWDRQVSDSTAAGSISQLSDFTRNTSEFSCQTAQSQDTRGPEISC